MTAAELRALIAALNASAPERIERLNQGQAVTVRMNERGGKYLDPVAVHAAQRGLLVYCGRANPLYRAQPQRLC